MSVNLAPEVYEHAISAASRVIRFNGFTTSGQGQVPEERQTSVAVPMAEGAPGTQREGEAHHLMRSCEQGFVRELGPSCLEQWETLHLPRVLESWNRRIICSR